MTADSPSPVDTIVPAWAEGVFDLPRWTAFADAVTSTVRFFGGEPAFIDDSSTVVFALPAGRGAEAVCDITRLAQACAQRPKDLRGRVSLHFADLIDRHTMFAAKPIPWDVAREVVRPRVRAEGDDGPEARPTEIGMWLASAHRRPTPPRGWLDRIGRRTSRARLTRPVAPGLHAALVLDLPGLTLDVDGSMMRGWPREHEIWETALGNIRAVRPDERAFPFGQEDLPTIRLLNGRSQFVSSWVLLVDELIPSGGQGVLVGVPTRSTLLYHVMRDSADVVRALVALDNAAQILQRSGSRSISTAIFWRREGRFERATVGPPIVGGGQDVVAIDDPPRS